MTADPGGPVPNSSLPRESSLSDCLFCRVARGEIPARIVYETELLLAFEDIHPQAPQHILLIPRAHIPSVAHLGEGEGRVAGELLLAAGEVARRTGLEARGYRVVANVGEEGGQTVPHLHLHLLGGRPMSWPPG